MTSSWGVPASPGARASPLRVQDEGERPGKGRGGRAPAVPPPPPPAAARAGTGREPSPPQPGLGLSQAGALPRQSFPTLPFIHAGNTARTEKVAKQKKNTHKTTKREGSGSAGRAIGQLRARTSARTPDAGSLGRGSQARATEGTRCPRRRAARGGGERTPLGTLSGSPRGPAADPRGQGLRELSLPRLGRSPGCGANFAGGAAHARGPAPRPSRTAGGPRTPSPRVTRARGVGRGVPGPAPQLPPRPRPRPSRAAEGLRGRRACARPSPWWPWRRLPGPAGRLRSRAAVGPRRAGDAEGGGWAPARRRLRLGPDCGRWATAAAARCSSS